MRKKHNLPKSVTNPCRSWKGSGKNRKIGKTFINFRAIITLKNIEKRLRKLSKSRKDIVNNNWNKLTHGPKIQE